MRRFPSSWQNVFRKLGFARPRYRISKRPSRSRWYRQLHLEPLEDRQLLSITVNTLVDEDDGIAVGGISLRDAIAAAMPIDTIDFAASLTSGGPATITLTHGELLINKSLTINGPGPNLLTIDASGNDPTPSTDNNNGSRVLRIDDGSTLTNKSVSISGLTITGGDIGTKGGGILNREDLVVADSIITDNAAFQGGGIGSYGGFLMIDNVTVTNNRARAGTVGHGGNLLRNSNRRQRTDHHEQHHLGQSKCR